MQVADIRTVLCGLILCASSLLAQTGTIFVSPTGNDANDGKTAPVKTLGIAILRAVSGNGPNEVIELAAGTYSAVNLANTLTAAPATWSKNLLIQGAPHAVVTIQGLTVNIPRLTFKYLRIQGNVSIDMAANYVRLENMAGLGTSHWSCLGADNVVWYRCFCVDVHSDVDDRIRIGSDRLDLVPINMLLEECYFRGSDVTGPDGNHIDCIQIIGCDHLTFKNCVVWNAPTGVIFTGPATGTSYITDITYDGCYIGDGAFYNSANSYNNIIIKNCILNDGPGYPATPGTKGDQWEYNKILFWSEGNAWPTHFIGNILKVTGWNSTNPSNRAVPAGNTKDPNLVLTRPATPNIDVVCINPGTLFLDVAGMRPATEWGFKNPVRVSERIISGARPNGMNGITVHAVNGALVGYYSADDLSVSRPGQYFISIGTGANATTRPLTVLP